MHYQAAAGAIVLAGFALLQSCPAPVFALVAIIPEIVVTGVELGLEFAPNKRSLRVEDAFEVEAKFNPRALDERGTCMPIPKGVPSNVITNCCNSLKGAHIIVSGKNAKSGIKMTGIPFPCISAAPLIDGVGTVPFACGDDCLQWINMSQNEFDTLKKSFLANAK